MKTGMVVLLVLLACVRSVAQFQELEQLKLNLEKLAQMKLMLSQAKQGYQVLQNGYNSVRDAAKGNYSLHKNYLDQMLRVSVAVKHSPAVMEIFSAQSKLLQAYQAGWQRISGSKLFSVKELSDIRSSYQFILDALAGDLETIDAVMAEGKLRMSDAERLQAIGIIKTHVADNLKAVMAMNQEGERIIALRLQQKRDMDAVRRLNGIK